MDGLGSRTAKSIKREKIKLKCSAFRPKILKKFAGGKRSGSKSENFLQKFSWKKV